jgi:tRNA(Ser,Leu) C12 N-acetylase TAN1
MTPNDTTKNVISEIEKFVNTLNVNPNQEIPELEIVLEQLKEASDMLNSYLVFLMSHTDDNEVKEKIKKLIELKP